MKNHCCGRPPCPPPCPPQPRWLLPRVIGAARDTFRCLPACLAVDDLPRGLCGPFSVLSIEAAGEAQILPPPRCGCGAPRCAEAVIPLIVWVCDGCGRRHCGSSELRLHVRIPACAPGATLAAQADVRFIGADTAPCRPVFDVRLAVCVDVYAVRMETCSRRRPPAGAECDPFF